jgi:hypothetical protein
MHEGAAMKWLLLAMISLAGCASTGKPLHVACLACATLEASGACAAATTRSPTRCGAGEELWVINWSYVVDRGARPVIECRPRRAGEDLP